MMEFSSGYMTYDTQQIGTEINMKIQLSSIKPEI